jgi:hypothetical protein
MQLQTQLAQALVHSALPDEELAAHLALLQKDISNVLKRHL